MKFSLFLMMLLGTLSSAQVGIGTTNPQGALDVTTSDNLGIVLPRVTTVEDVTDGNGNPPVDGTLVFDTTLGMPCVYTNSKWACFGFDSDGNTITFDGTPPAYDENKTYFKASTNGSLDQFGNNVILSGDGLTMAISAPRESSNATGINGNQADDSATNSGAVYVFVNVAGTWMQQAYIKSSNSDVTDFFGRTLGISTDGNTLAVGSNLEDSIATGVNGNQTDNSAASSGAIYIFERTGSVWSQTAYIKASNTAAGDLFGAGMDLSDDGNTLAVGAAGESSDAIGINGDENNDLMANSGAVYVYLKSGAVWSQQAYIKSSNSENGDAFGTDVALSADGNTLVVSADDEESNASGINGNQLDNSAARAGAAYVFVRVGSNWSQEAYLKSSNTEQLDLYGTSLAISGDGLTVAVSAIGEDSSATGANGSEADNTTSTSGAVYVYRKAVGVWSQDAYLKATNTGVGDQFGFAGLSLSYDGTIIAVGSYLEDSIATGVNGDEDDNSGGNSGAVYIFTRSSSWSRTAYIKATNTDNNDTFGGYVLPGYHCVSLNSNGNILVVGANSEDSNAAGIGGDQTNNLSPNSGAVYLYEN